MILLYDGYDTDSPMPRKSRAISSSAKLRTNPVLSVATDQISTPSASSQFTLNRSTSQPARIWQNAYVQKNEDSRMPSCDAESPRSSLSSGAAMDSLPRST